MLIQAPRGTRDILPEDQKYYRFVQNTFEKLAEINGFEKIETPIFEYESIFKKGTGVNSEIVQKEMYEVKRLSNDLDEDADKKLRDKLILRPEYTPGVVRSYIENGMNSWSQPVQLYYYGPVFRYNRPQKGRLRQFYQMGVELIGPEDPGSDARVISLTHSVCKALRLSDVVILVNSIGCENCRPNIVEFMKEFFSKKKAALCENCKSRLDMNPMRILDCKNKECQKIADLMPPVIDQLCEGCKDHFKQVLEFLDEAEVPYELEPRLVRGLDYYTKTVFEVVLKDDTSRQNAIGGGGRYDDLIKLYGEKQTPALGMSFGVERIIEILKSKKLKLGEEEKAQVFIAQLGEKAKKKAITLIEQLQNEDIIAKAALSKNNLKSQLRNADKLEVPITIIFGQREVMDGTAIIRDMKEGLQEIVEEEMILDKVKQKLKLK